jgi:predicted component of type VI protein secretion system
MNVPEVTLIQEAPETKVLARVRRERISIGKRPECDVRLPGTLRISATHAVLTWRDGELYVSDEKTAGGSFVDGERVEMKPVRVRSGSELRFGDCVIKVSFDA